MAFRCAEIGSFLPSLLIFTVLAMGCTKSAQTTGGDTPLTASQLEGTRLSDIRDKDLSWSFDETRVTIENAGNELPNDIINDILASGESYTQIAADWAFDDTANELVLTNIEVDGEKVDRESRINIAPAGHVRVNLGSRQYNKQR